MPSPLISNMLLAYQAEAGTNPIGFFGMMVAMFAIFYFLLIRPQQKRMKDHKSMVSGLSRNDTVVTAGGILGKVSKVTPDSEEVTIEIATGVKVKVLRSTLQDVRAKNSPKPANDSAAKKK